MIKDYTELMNRITSKTLFSKIPDRFSKESDRIQKSKKIQYLLEKLHIQKEKIRIDTQLKEEQSKLDATEQLLDEQFEGKMNQEIVESETTEYAKDTAIKKETDAQIVNDLIKKSNRCIISISSLFPWDLFPNIIYVEESRVTFKFNQFLASQSHSVDIKDISNVVLESSLFFSTLQIVSRTYTQNDIKIGNLNTKKAKEVQRIIEGLRTFAENNINTSGYEVDELIAKIGEFQNNQI